MQQAMSGSAPAAAEPGAPNAPIEKKE